ncbi:MAG: hypothetical protein AB2L24_16260 [Mangrovibacterium sp.]
MKKLFLIASVLLSVLTSFADDILVLNNNMAFKGKVTKISDCTVVFKSNGDKYVIPASDIYSVKFEDTKDKVYTKFMEMTDTNSNKCLMGKLDAEQYHGKKGEHFLLGALFGPFAMIGTAFSNPTPVRGKRTCLLSKNEEIFSDPEYLSCYKKKAKSQLIVAEALGCLSWILILGL